MSWGLWNEETLIKCQMKMLESCVYLAGPSEKGPPKLWYRFSMEFRFSPSAVRSCPIASDTRFGSDSAARINVSSPIMPNWLFTIVGGMFVTRPLGEVCTPRLAFSLGRWWCTPPLTDWCPTTVSDCIMSMQRFEPIEFLLSIMFVPSAFIMPPSAELWWWWWWPGPPEPMTLFADITAETDDWCDWFPTTALEPEPTTPARLSLVPGSAGKSSLDIWNSVCSDVGCFTIPTEKRNAKRVKIVTTVCIYIVVLSLP